MTDDVIHSTLYYTKYINSAIVANFLHRPLKLGQANRSTGNTSIAIKKFCSHGNSLFPSPNPFDFNMLVIFSLKNIKQGHKLELMSIYACWIMHMRHH